MSAYLIADVDVRDPPYPQRASATHALCHGLCRRRDVLEGARQPRRLVIPRRSTFEDAKRFFASPEYLEIAHFLQDPTTSRLIPADGLPFIPGAPPPHDTNSGQSAITGMAL